MSGRRGKGRRPTIKPSYPLNPPFAYATIVQERDGTMRYEVKEPTLSKVEAETLEYIKGLLLEEFVLPTDELRSRELVSRYLRNQILDKVRRYNITLPKKDSLDRILYYIERDFVGYGKIDAIMRDHLIEDISADGGEIPLYVWHREYESIPTNVIFGSNDELDSFVVRLAYKAGKHISVAKPLLDASLPDGSRLQLTYSKEVTRRGSTFTIRKFRADPLTVVDLIQFNTLSADMASFLWYLIENRVSVLVAGGIASGKTTTLNCLATFIKPAFKIVSVEDTAELNIPLENWIPSVSRPSSAERSRVDLFDLLKASLRQRPDYIIVGEVRGEEAYVLFQALSTGHLGLATIHAESVGAVFRRLKSKPMNIPEDFLAALDVVALERRILRKGRFQRKIVVLSEIVRPEEVKFVPKSAKVETFGKLLHTHDIFAWNPKLDTFPYMGHSVILERLKQATGLSDEAVEGELAKRKAVLKWMVEKDIRRVSDVGSVMKKFYADPDGFMKRIGYKSIQERFGIEKVPVERGELGPRQAKEGLSQEERTETSTT